MNRESLTSVTSLYQRVKIGNALFLLFYEFLPFGVLVTGTQRKGYGQSLDYVMIRIGCLREKWNGLCEVLCSFTFVLERAAKGNNKGKRRIPRKNALK